MPRAYLVDFCIKHYDNEIVEADTPAEAVEKVNAMLAAEHARSEYGYEVLNVEPIEEEDDDASDQDV